MTKQAECPICFLEINDERCRVCEQGHKFHNVCYENQNTPTIQCPKCRSASIESCNGNYNDLFEDPEFLEKKVKERRIAQLTRELNILKADLNSTQMALNYGDPGYTFDSQNELSETIQNLKASIREKEEEIVFISDPNYKLSDRSYDTYKYIENLVKKDWYGPSEFGGRRSKRKSSKRKSSKRKSSTRRKTVKRKTSKKTRK